MSNSNLSEPIEHRLNTLLSFTLFVSVLILNERTLAELAPDGKLASSTSTLIRVLDSILLAGGAIFLVFRRINGIRKLGANIFLMIAAIIVILALTETGARIWFALYPPLPKTLRESREIRPPPYQNAEYFGLEMLDEAQRVLRWKYPEGTRLIIPIDTSGTYYNIRGGFRKTCRQPAQPSSRLFLFGGSTVFSSEVPDCHTIASYLQAYINKNEGDIIVHNAGVTTVNSVQQLERLETIPLRKDDVVIFYDGVNEIIQSLYYGTPQGWIVGETRKNRKKMNLKLYAIHNILKDYSKFIEELLYPISPSIFPEHIRDKNTLDSLVRRMREVYHNSIIKADSICRQAGAHFYHFLQPHIFSDGNYSDYERRLLGNGYIIPPGMKEAYLAGYPVLQKLVSELEAKGIKTKDISHVFDKRPKETEFFLDFCHVNHEANKLVAATIFPVIR